MPGRLTFRRRQRLHLQRDFDRVLRQRCSAGDGLLVVYAAANDLAWTRLGIRTGRRLGNAVARARMRRRVREAFRSAQHRLPAGLDLICVPRGPAGLDAAVQELARSLERLAERVRRKLLRRREPR